MRRADLLGECARNINSGTTRGLVGAIALWILMVCAVGVDGLAARDILVSQRDLRSSGAATSVVSAAGGIDPVRCEALDSVAGVEGAFALRVAERVVPAALPDSTVAVYDLVGDVSGVLGTARRPVAGVLVAGPLADQLGLVAGQRLPLLDAANGPVVAGVFAYPSDGRNSQLAGALLQEVPPSGLFDSCWVAIWPPNPELDALTFTAVAFGAPTGEVSIDQLNTTFGQPRATQVVLGERATVLAPLAGGMLAAAIGFLQVRQRRVELAIARHLGQTRREQLVQIVIETLAWVIPAGVGASAVLLIALTRALTATEAGWMVWTALTGVGGMALACLAGALAAALTITPRRMQAWTQDR